ncbi:MAG TPA: beta-ketoacyl synthase N-terminal-like domain-containing protein [Chthoniobacterales bacterium]|jgi:3-oxoacyl-(acyl-carrier-protein) synthase
MSVGIAGTGWVTPLGSDIEEVWSRLLAGHQPAVQEISDPIGERAYPVYQIPPAALKKLPPHPRLRRASAISRFAAAAGLAALADANLTIDEKLTGRLALIFAVANGGVIYTKRFYTDVIKTGADAASPLLFPETVFNAAASHLAAIIGLTGASYTVVGDGSIGLTAIQMGEDLLTNPGLDFCLVVAAEEADWLLCDAYKKWRLLRPGGPVKVFEKRSRGMILSEGAGAVLLSRKAPFQIAAISAGSHFTRRSEVASALAGALTNVGSGNDAIVISSANGTFVDAAELEAIEQVLPNATVYSPKEALGESVAASTLWQVIIATEALRRKQLPCPQYAGGKRPSGPIQLLDAREITVLSCGLNQQAGATRLVSL